VCHGRVQHRQRQHGPGDHPPGQVPDLRLPLGSLRRLGILCRARGAAAGRPGRRAACRRGGGGSGRAREAARILAGTVVPGLSRLDDQGAVDHVHAAGEPERPSQHWVQPHRGLRECRQRGANPQVREHDAGGAVARLLPVEDQLGRDPLAQPDHLRAVPAPDRDLQPLHPSGQLRGTCLAGAEEEPAQPRDDRCGREPDDDG
jgi:hypothetical protein